MKAQSTKLLLEMTKIREHILRRIISNLPENLLPSNLSDMPYCLANCQSISVASQSDSKLLTGFQTLILGHTANNDFQRKIVYLQAVYRAALGVQG
jgi:hypothetical protein